MGKNVSNADRVIRVIVAIIAFVIAAMVGFGSVLGIILAIVGVIMLVTAAIGFCPLYRVFGINTCKVPTSSKDSVAAAK